MVIVLFWCGDYKNIPRPDGRSPVIDSYTPIESEHLAHAPTFSFRPVQFFLNFLFLFSTSLFSHGVAPTVIRSCDCELYIRVNSCHCELKKKDNSISRDDPMTSLMRCIDVKMFVQLFLLKLKYETNEFLVKSLLNLHDTYHRI